MRTAPPSVVAGKKAKGRPRWPLGKGSDARVSSERTPGYRVLVTSGGTRAPLDEVRWIGNLSTGRFGAEIARACLARGASVVHLHARGAEHPFERHVNLLEDWRSQLAAIREEGERLVPDCNQRYRSITFIEPIEYGQKLEMLLKEEAIDIVFLAAAVSDFAPEQVRGKISSDTQGVMLHLIRVPKFIARVKEWSPTTFLVGFKLMVGATPEELVAVARRAGGVNRADVTVANDLRPLKEGNHTIHLVRDGRPVETYSAMNRPAEQLVDRVFQWRSEQERA